MRLSCKLAYALYCLLFAFNLFGNCIIRSYAAQLKRVCFPMQPLTAQSLPPLTYLGASSHTLATRD